MITLLVGASPSSSSALVEALAERVDHIIALDGGGSPCRAAGVTPSLLLGDLDSLPEDDRAWLEARGVPFEIHPAEKDDTDLGLAVTAARRHGTRRLFATGVLGGRLDHTLASVGSLARAADLRPSIVEADVSVEILHHASHSHATVHGHGTTFSAMAVLGEATISIEGGRWPLDRVTVSPLDAYGVSNVVSGRCATVCVHDGTLAVIAPTVAGLRGDLQDDDDTEALG